MLAPLISAFIRRLFTAVISATYADRWASLDRVRSTFVALGLCGLFALTAALVMLSSPGLFVS